MFSVCMKHRKYKLTLKSSRRFKRFQSAIIHMLSGIVVIYLGKSLTANRHLLQRSVLLSSFGQTP